MISILKIISPAFNFLNKYSEIFNNEDLDREYLAALFFNNNDLSDDFKDYILKQMAP